MLRASGSAMDPREGSGVPYTTARYSLLTRPAAAARWILAALRNRTFTSLADLAEAIDP